MDSKNCFLGEQECDAFRVFIYKENLEGGYGLWGGVRSLVLNIDGMMWLIGACSILKVKASGQFCVDLLG
jgi:hypothetical protein